MNEANGSEGDRQDKAEECLNDFKKRLEKEIRKPKFALELAGFIVLSIYALFTGLMYSANKTAADAAKRSADAFEAQVAPNIQLVPDWLGSFHNEEGKTVWVSVQIRNVGMTNALDVTAATKLKLGNPNSLPLPSEKNFTDSDFSDHWPALVPFAYTGPRPPGYGFITRYIWNVPKETYPSLKEQKTVLYIWGEVRYSNSQKAMKPFPFCRYVLLEKVLNKKSAKDTNGEGYVNPYDIC
jgi:hypothetical protein